MADWANVAQAATWLSEGRDLEFRHRKGPGVWMALDCNSLTYNFEYRLAPRTIDIGGVKVNAPILERPSDSSRLFSLRLIGEPGYGPESEFNDLAFASGCIFAHKADAIAARDAIVRLLTQGAE